MKTNFNLQRLIVLFFGIFCVLFIALGLRAIAVTDDYWLATFLIKKGRPFFSPFIWSFSQYMQWSGQLVTNFLQGVFTVSPLRTNLISALHAALFIGASLFWSLKFYKRYEEDRTSRFLFAVTHLIIIFIFTFKVLGEAIFMAASTYVWGYIFFVLGYTILKSNLFSKYTWLRYLVFFALGNSTEFLIIPFLYLFWKVRKNEDLINLKKYFLVFVIGLLVSLFSPGTVAHLKGGLSLISYNPLDQLYHVQVVTTNAFSLLGYGLLFVVPLCFCFQVSSSMNLSDLKEEALENFVLAISSILILIPVIGPSADSVYFYFLLFFSLSVFWSIQYLKRRFAQFRLPQLIHQGAILLSVLGCLEIVGENFVNAWGVRESFLRQHTEIEMLSDKVKQMKARRIKDPMNGHLLFYSDITNDKGDINNVARAEYYGLESVVAN